MSVRAVFRCPWPSTLLLACVVAGSTHCAADGADDETLGSSVQPLTVAGKLGGTIAPAGLTGPVIPIRVPFPPVTGPTLNPRSSVFGDSSAWSSYFCTEGEVCKVADVNGDGFADVVAFHHSAAQAAVWVALSNGSSFQNPQIWNPSFCTAGQTCEVGDLDGNGVADLIAFTQGSSPQVLVAFSNGSNTFAPAGGFSVNNYFCLTGEVCKVADLDRDGKVDFIAFQHGVNGNQGVWASLSNGLGQAGPDTQWSSYFCTASQTCAVGDVTGDGAPDVIAFDQAASGNVWVGENDDLGLRAAQQFNRGSGGTQWNKSSPFTPFCTYPSEFETCLIADVDADGVADAVEFLADYDDTTNVKVATSTTSGFATATLWDDAFCLNGTCLTGDVNGDGRNDVVNFQQYAAPTVWVSLASMEGKLLDRGGPGMIQAQHPVYMTYYGTFENAGTPALLNSFVSNLGASGFFRDFINSYPGIPATLNLQDSYVYPDTSAFGNTVGDVGAVLTDAWTNRKHQALDPNGLYVLVLGTNVDDSSSDSFDAWHGGFATGIADALVRNPYSAYHPYLLVNPSPNGNPEADTAASPLLHEIAEALTGGWNIGPGNNEPGDVCVGVVGSTYPSQANNGSQANLHLGAPSPAGYDFLVQELWRNGPGPANRLCAGAPFQPAPTSYWTFDLAQATNLSYDIMPAANHATLYKAKPYDGLMIHGDMLALNGVDSHVAIPDSTTLKFATTGMTASMWLYMPNGALPSQLGYDTNVLDKQSNQPNGWGLEITHSTSAACPGGNCPVFYTKGPSGTNWLVSSTSLSHDYAYHIAVTYQPGGNLSIYVNGVLAGSMPATNAPADNNQPFWIGSSAYWQNHYTEGYIDEVGYWQRALSASDVQRLFNLPYTRSGPR